MEAHHFRDLEDVAGVGKAHDYSCDIMVFLRWVGLGDVLSLSVDDSRSLPLASFPLGADRGPTHGSNVARLC